DIVALPSLWDENHPMVAVEAIRARRSLLVSDLGGLPECVRPDLDGWVLPAGDVEAWGEQLALLAANPTLVARCRAQLPAPRSEDHMAEDFEAAYLHLAGG
ncbi:MAG: glycosyltransferase, partial [Myxococcota bacterium]|nr:glycosyltransferase [Myxococcota bacterium]